MFEFVSIGTGIAGPKIIYSYAGYKMLRRLLRLNEFYQFIYPIIVIKKIYDFHCSF